MSKMFGVEQTLSTTRSRPGRGFRAYYDGRSIRAWAKTVAARAKRHEENATLAAECKQALDVSITIEQHFVSLAEVEAATTVSNLTTNLAEVEAARCAAVPVTYKTRRM